VPIKVEWERGTHKAARRNISSSVCEYLGVTELLVDNSLLAKETHLEDLSSLQTLKISVTSLPYERKTGNLENSWSRLHRRGWTRRDDVERK
jgi:hypothetical protein